MLKKRHLKECAQSKRAFLKIKANEKLKIIEFNY